MFTGLFAGWALMRSYAPDVWQTEKPMDMAFVNATNASEWFPPHDPWQSGEDLNYYYFGHYLVAFVLRVTGVDPAVGFNLGVALFFALVGVAVFGLTSTVYAAATAARTTRRRAPRSSSAWSEPCSRSFSATSPGGVQFLEDFGRFATYDWWAPSRVIDGTANEFPYFSFLLADLHAHMLVTPFTLVCIGYAVQLALHGPPAFPSDRPPRRAVAELGLAALVLGVLYPTNSFDFPTAVAIGAGALVLWSLDVRGPVAAARRCGVARSLRPGSRCTSRSGSRSRLRQRASGWCATTCASPSSHGTTRSSTGSRSGCCWRCSRAALRRVPGRYVVWAGSASFFVLVLLAPPNLAGLAVALVVAAAAVYITFASGSAGQTERVVWLLAAVALLLLASGEIVYVRDVFDGSSSFRFNTVFKTGYQAWFLLCDRRCRRRVLERALARTTCSCRLALRARRPGGTRARVPRGGVVLPVADLRERPDPRRDRLDAADRAGRRRRDRVAARRTLQDDSIVLEAVGNDFDPDGRARVSTFTGLATVMGWSGHEVQWGHDPGSRGRRRPGRSTARPTPDEARSLLERYGVRYVFVGSLERRDYPADASREVRGARDRGLPLRRHRRLRVSRIVRRGGRLRRRARKHAVDPHARVRSTRASSTSPRRCAHFAAPSGK